jgi:hypothetical protein
MDRGTGIGYDDRLTAFGQRRLEIQKELAVRSRAVVPLHRVDLLVQRDGSTANGGSGLDHQPPSARLQIGPIDDNHRMLDTGEQSPGDPPSLALLCLEFVGIPQRLALSCVAPKERSD